MSQLPDLEGLAIFARRLAVPMSFGISQIAPSLPDFLAAFSEVSIDLHLSDAVVDLIGEGFDAALRIAVLLDSALIARKSRDRPKEGPRTKP
jgi:DNA-binding transcriptional LysR family regulator